MGAGAHEARPQRRQAQQLAADQASGPVRPGEWRRAAAQGPLGRLRAAHGRHHGRTGRQAEALHEGAARETCQARRAEARHGARGRRGASRSEAPQRRRPRFVPPQLARLVPFAPPGSGWGHEIKFDGYRMQMRVAGGTATLRTRKGLDWTSRFPEIARAGEGLPDCLVDGEIVALDKRGVPSFSALQAGLVDEETGDFIYFVFDLLHADGKDFRKSPLAARKQRLSELIASSPRAPALRRALRDGRRGGPEVGLQDVAGGCRVETPRFALSLRARRRLAQDQVPRGARSRHRRLDGARRTAPLPARGRPPPRASRLRRTHRHRLRTEGRARARREAARARSDDEPVQRQGCAAQGRRRALGETEAGRRDRVRRLDRVRDAAAGRFQGTAGRQVAG